MKTTIENNHTVIRKPFDAELVKEQLDMGIPVCLDNGQTKLNIDLAVRVFDRQIYVQNLNNVDDYGWQSYGDCSDIITILPPLPKHPKPEDAPLLHLYAAHGIEVGIADNTGEFLDSEFTDWLQINGVHDNWEITHAIDSETGERVEVAIKE